jgi:hypothetical protein
MDQSSWFVTTMLHKITTFLDRVIRHRDAIISHLNWVCIFLGCHAFGFYIHNDTMQALGRPQDMFSDKAISLQPILPNGFKGYTAAPGTTSPNALATASYIFWWRSCYFRFKSCVSSNEFRNS